MASWVPGRRHKKTCSLVGNTLLQLLLVFMLDAGKGLSHA
jgi:hypothetical protein